MTVLIIIAILSIVALLVIHEFGHFIIAKLFKVEVEEFGVGLPPRLIGKKIGGTTYSINLLPFGAFVKIPEVEGESRKESSPRVSSWKKALILFAGSAAFWLVGVILLTGIFASGVFQEVSDDDVNLVNPRVQITAVASGSPAEEAGIKPGVVVQKIVVGESQEFSVNKVGEIQEIISNHQGEEITLIIEEGEMLSEISLVPRISPPQGEGAIGVALTRVAEKNYSFFQALVEGTKETVALTVAVVVGLVETLVSLLGGQGLPQGVEFMGPVGIGSLAVQAAGVGVAYFLQFIAIISIYLAIFNLLPIPALDGGRLLFLGIEKIKGSPISQKIEQSITAGFFVFLLLLILFVTVNDIIKLL